MSLVPSDIVTDLDLLALDPRALADYGDAVGTLDDQRHTAVMQWIRPRLEQMGYPAERHRTRKAPDALYAQISSATTEYTAAGSDLTFEDVPLGTIFTGGDATDALYVMSRTPFRGVYFGIYEQPNAVAATSSPVVWANGWTSVQSLVDGTHDGSQSFAQSGVVSYKPPDEWHGRTFENTFGYWAKFHVASLTATTTAAQVLPVVQSRLSYPAALYTLGLLYQGAWASGRGDWELKSERLLTMAETELTKVIGLVADEFDRDLSGAVSSTEVNSLKVQYDMQQLVTWGRG